MTVQKLETPDIDYYDNTFYIYVNGELKSIYFSILDEKMGADKKIRGISKNNMRITRYMSPKSFEKQLKTWFTNAKNYGDTIEVYTEYDDPYLWATKLPQIMKGRKTTTTKPAVRKPVSHKTSKKPATRKVKRA